MLSQVTNILETQNIEDAEINLNREITKLRMAQDSLMSQRTFNHQNHASSEDIGKIDEIYGGKRDNNEIEVNGADLNNTKMQDSDILQIKGKGEDRYNPYNNENDNIHLSSDLTVVLKGSNKNSLTKQPSRNKVK